MTAQTDHLDMKVTEGKKLCRSFVQLFPPSIDGEVIPIG
jgi:hypothetical protein